MPNQDAIDSSGECTETPLVDLLRRVPADARLLIIEDSPYSTQYIPVGRLCHEAAALLAPSRQPCIDERERVVANDWKPIETAPKDGTLLLLVPTRYAKWNVAIPMAGMWLGMWVIFNADEAVQRVDPTHWMPLQPSPQGAGQAQGRAE